MTFINYFLPNGAQTLGLVAALANLAAFAVLGAVLCGRKRLGGADIFVGWGAVSAVFVLGGVFGPVPFTWLAYFVWAAAAASAVILWRRHGGGEEAPAAADVLWRVLALGAPLFFLVAAMVASQWDEFSQWIPNASYIFRHDGFPGSSMPKSPSTFPAYPYGLPIIAYLTSKLTGGFVENAGALANLGLLLSFAPLYLHVVGRGLGVNGTRLRGWGMAALGALGVTVFSTIFIQKLVFTAYADTSTAIVFGVAGVLLWRILETLASGEEPGGVPVSSLAWQFGLLMAVFLNIKQTNLVLLVLLMGGAALVVLRDPDIKIVDFMRLLPAMLIPGLIVYLSWRYYVSINLAGREFSLMPYESWRPDQAFYILGKMFAALAKKGAYFLMMVVITGFAVRGLWRFRGGFDRIAIITGAVFIAHNLFLWFMYIAAFGEYEALNIASYWRYNTQLGILGSTTAAFGAAILWGRHVSPRLEGNLRAKGLLAGFAVFLVLAMPVATAKKLRFDLKPQKIHLRLVGQELGRTLPEGSRLAVMDPGGNGFANQVIMFELTSGSGAGRGLSATYKIYQYNLLNKTPGEVRKKLDAEGVTHAWIHRVDDDVLKVLGMSLPPGSSHLLRYVGEGRWEFLKSWPYDGYQDPLGMPD